MDSSTQLCNGRTPLANRHCKNNAWFTSETWCGRLTLENVAYSEFVKIVKKMSMLKMLTNSTFPHTPQMAPDALSLLW